MNINYGIIGMGRWATETHIPVLNQMDQARIVALSSRNPENLGRGMEVSAGEPRTFSDYSDLLDMQAML